MSKAVFVRRGDAFYPTSQEGRDILFSVPDGKEVMGEFRPKRNLEHHKLFFGLINLLVDNDVFENSEAAMIALKIATGEFDSFVNSDGKVFYVPRSIDFSSMDQARFRRFFDRAVHVILTKYLQGSDEILLRDQVLHMVDQPDKRALGRRVK